MARLQNRQILDRPKPIELNLEIFSFAGGENTLGSDHELKSNEARRIKNWKATSLGSMVRAEGFNEVADGGVTYTGALDLLIQHNEGTNNEVYGVIEGDLVILSGANINQEDASAFTSGLISHAVSEGDKLWITNTTDNLQQKVIGVGIATPSEVPAGAGARIYTHKSRLISEGSTTNPKRVYGSKVGTGNWDASDAWSKSEDAWSIDLPDATEGCVPAFPSGREVAVFTKFSVYALSGFPKVGFRPIGAKAFGCSAPYSIAQGPEGVFFISEFPTKGVILWDGVNFVNLTINHDFIDSVNLDKRIYGIYRDQQYFLFYNDTGTSDSFPNTLRIYDTRFGRWWQREINSDLSDSFGYPALLTQSANELYAGSSQKDKVYELEVVTDDEGNDTQADYKTKDFTSRDFGISSGGQFGIDNVRLKLLGVYVTYNGTVGTLGINWTADKGKRSGSRVIDMTSDGDKLNIDFVLNSSKLVSSPGAKTIFKSFKNNAVGFSFNFQITNNGQSTRPEVSKIKIIAIAQDE